MEFCDAICNFTRHTLAAGSHSQRKYFILHGPAAKAAPHTESAINL